MEMQTQSSPFNALAGHCGGRCSFGHNSPAARAREVFKPSTDSSRLLVSTEKKFSVLGLGFSWRDVISRGIFVFLWPILPGPGRQSNEPFFGSSFFWKLDYHPSLESPLAF